MAGAGLDTEAAGEDKIELKKVELEADQQDDRARTDIFGGQVSVHESRNLCADDIEKASLPFLKLSYL